jgi:DNA-binding response OmpR family regulator
MTVTRGDGLPRLEGAADPDAVMHTSTMNGANGSADDERGPVTGEKETLAGILGRPPHLPDPDKGWDELSKRRPPPSTWRYARPMMIGGGPAGQERPARLLLVDDDSNLLVVLAEQLRDDGYDVATARDGVEALRRLESGWPDLAIIDMMMPRLDGLSLAREIKARADLPIIVLSAIDAADSKAELLDEVAEDYVTKPFHYPELRARINRVLRRLGDRLPGQRVVVGPALALELHRRSATVNGVEVVLTPIESRLLYALAANLGQTVSTETLLLRGWADTEDADPSYVWVSMRRLRTKLEVDPNRPRHLVTVRGIGYRLEVEPT